MKRAKQAGGGENFVLSFNSGSFIEAIAPSGQAKRMKRARSLAVCGEAFINLPQQAICI